MTDYIVLQKAEKRKILIWDIGYGVEHAKRLAQDGHEVYYFNEWVEPLPKFSRYAIGLGFEGVEKVKSFFRYVDDVDLIAFIFLGRGDMADWLREKGYRVYGAGLGEKLETDRLYAKKIQKKIGLPTQSYKVFNDVDDVLNYIKKSGEKKVVKINIFRGDLETLKATDYESAAMVLNGFKATLGPFSKHFEFLVEDWIDDVVCEAGFDLFFNGQQFLKPYLWGYLSGRFYIGKYENELPEPLAMVAEKITPILRGLNYRGAISTEVMMTKNGTPYVLDWTCRMPYPLSYIYTKSLNNYSDVIWACSKGDNIEIDNAGKYVGYMQLLTSPTSPIKSWIKVDAPNFKDIKLKQPSKVKDSIYTMPGEELEVAVPVSAGASVKGVLQNLEDIGEGIKSVTIDTEEILGSKMKVLETIKNGRSVGLEF